MPCHAVRCRAPATSRRSRERASSASESARAESSGCRGAGSGRRKCACDEIDGSVDEDRTTTQEEDRACRRLSDPRRVAAGTVARSRRRNRRPASQPEAVGLEDRHASDKHESSAPLSLLPSRRLSPENVGPLPGAEICSRDTTEDRRINFLRAYNGSL